MVDAPKATAQQAEAKPQKEEEDVNKVSWGRGVMDKMKEMMSSNWEDSDLR